MTTSGRIAVLVNDFLTFICAITAAIEYFTNDVNKAAAYGSAAILFALWEIAARIRVMTGSGGAK